jgi:hypothetical protein
LVDIDGESVRLGVARQGLSESEKLRVHGDAELTGARLTERQHGANRLTKVDIARLTRIVSSFPGPDLPKPFDLAVSTCVLSQLMGDFTECLGGQLREIGPLLLALRNRHIDLLLGYVASGGVALLISDMVSSDTAPQITTCPPALLDFLRDQLLAEANFIHGTNPHAIEKYVRDHRPDVSVELRPSWRWPIDTRTFLVNALRFRRPNLPASPRKSRCSSIRGGTCRLTRSQRPFPGRRMAPCSQRSHSRIR